VARFFPPIVTDFQRDFDQLFDELLIGRWRSPSAESEPAMVLERDDVYEVRLCTGSFKPSDLEVMASEKRLTVRAGHRPNAWERTLNFADPVDPEKVRARWADRVLTIILPKKEKQPPRQRA
jgi:HSP20 family molecular chaperone IbpA